MLVKIVEDFNAIEGWGVGDVVDITDPEVLLAQGKVVAADTPVAEEEVVEEPVEEVEEEVVEEEEAEEIEEEPVEGAEEVEELSWNELRAKAKEEGINVKGMNREEIEEALNA